MNYMEAAFAPAEAKYAALVMFNTWGHLEPKKRLVYTGWIVFAFSVYGDIVPTNDFFEDAEGNELDSSSGFAIDMRDFIADNAKEEGNIYRFDGACIRYKNGKCRFSGKTVKLVL